MENNIEKTSLELAYTGLKQVLEKELKLKKIVGFGTKPMEYDGFSTLVVLADKVVHHCIIDDNGHRLSEWKEVKDNDKIVKGA